MEVPKSIRSLPGGRAPLEGKFVVNKPPGEIKWQHTQQPLAIFDRAQGILEALSNRGEILDVFGATTE